MGLVNYYPKTGAETALPVYVSGIGAGHTQEAKTLLNAHDRVLLHQTINGCGIAMINGKKHMLTPGTMLFTPPGAVLDIAPTPSGWIDNWIAIDLPRSPEKEFSLISLGSEPMVFHPENPGKLSELFGNVSRSLTSATLSGRLHAAAEAYMILILAIEAAMGEEKPATTAEARLVFAATSYIDGHLSEKLSLENLCEVCGRVSKQYFCHVFRNQTGVTLSGYIMFRRISRAKILLSHTEKSISEICSECGFGSESYFYRCWKKYETGSPKDYRKSHTGVFV